MVREVRLGSIFIALLAEIASGFEVDVIHEIGNRRRENYGNPRKVVKTHALRDRV